MTSLLMYCILMTLLPLEVNEVVTNILDLNDDTAYILNISLIMTSLMMTSHMLDLDDTTVTKTLH